MFRQGDVLVVPVAEIPQAAQVVPRDKGRVILAYGEVTGHAHVVDAPEATLLTTTEQERFLRLVTAAPLVHEEHATITLPAGNYQVIRQAEYEPGSARRVAD